MDMHHKYISSKLLPIILYICFHDEFLHMSELFVRSRDDVLIDMCQNSFD